MPKEQKPAKSPPSANPVLPASVESSYRNKCKEIKKRITEIESSNDLLTARIMRARRAIQRMRLERAFLLQQLEARTDERVEDSEGSPSPPPTPSQKPLRIKRARKDPPPMDSPLRQPSPGPSSPGHDSVNAGHQDYSFVNQSFPSLAAGAPASPGPYPGPISARSQKPGGKGSRGKQGGPKRPPNAYMIFCEKERDIVRERESDKEGFDMHKALAQAWRDLKPEGQKPYFDEYDRHRQDYLEKVQQSRTGDYAPYNGGGQPAGRAMSAASSVQPASNYDAAGSPPPGSVYDNDDGEDQTMGGSDAGFTAVNR